MIRNSLLTSFRRLLRDKVYAGINIFGLAVGVSCCLLITMWIVGEVTYDRFHPHANRLYQVQEEITRIDGFHRWRAGSGIPLAPLAMQEIPAIEAATRLLRMQEVLQAGRVRSHEQVLFVDSNFFSIFGFTLASGDPVSALRGLSGVILSKRLAIKYFGTTDVIGRTITVNGRRELTVTGVLADPKGLSHIKPECIMPLEIALIDHPSLAKHWDAPSWTYVLAREGVGPDHIESQLTADAGRWRPEPGLTVVYHLAPIKSIHLASSIGGQPEEGTARETIYTYAIAAFIILLLACVNFASLTLARSSNRTREVGIRKALGGRRSDLVIQFLIECMVTAGIAVAAALILLEVLAPVFARLIGEDFSIDYSSLSLWVAAVAAIVISGALAGLYPAFYLSARHPAACFTGRQHPGWVFRNRNLLLITQFGLAAVLLMCAAVGRDQLAMMTTTDMGFTKENTIIVPLGNLRGHVRQVMSNEISGVDGVNRVSAASNILGGPDCHGLTFNVAGNPERTSLPMIWVDRGFLTMMDLQDVNGDLPADSSAVKGQMFFSLSAARKIGFTNRIPVRIEARADGDSVWYTSSVSTLLKDFHYRNLYTRYPPLALVVDPARCEYLYIRYQPGTRKEVTATIAEIWNRVLPDQPFESFLLDDYIRANYSRDMRFTLTLTSGSVLALIVACMGLISLSAYLIAAKRKEIGIRKVLGASMKSLIWLFSKRFLAAVVLATALAAPIAYWLSYKWLQGFLFRVNISPVSLVMIAAIIWLVALAGVAIQAAIAASANPTDSLRYE
jgi:putative ABC transport system permease protein